MSEREFCYWLQGYLELTPDAAPTPDQMKAIRDHLALVFRKVTPPVGGSPSTGGSAGSVNPFPNVTVSCDAFRVFC